MTKAQAAIKDRSALSLKEKKHWYHVPSLRCWNCGDKQVMRAYDPSWLGWETWCWVCGTKSGTAPAEGRVSFGLQVPRLVKRVPAQEAV